MLRVSVDTVIGKDQNFLYGLRVAGALMAKQGVKLGRGLPDADLRLLGGAEALREFQAEGGFARPTIVLAPEDPANVTPCPRTRRMLADPQLRLYLKPNTLRDPRRHNEPLIMGRHHYRLLAECFGENRGGPPEQPAPLAPATLAKIQPFSLATMRRFAAGREGAPDPLAPRPIDASFLGLIDYDQQFTGLNQGGRRAVDPECMRNDLFVGRHRRMAAQALMGLRGCRTLVATNQAAAPDLYRLVMDRSLICVSPWGMGEFAWRDYEAILNGCILVKPDTDHVLTGPPDIYQSGRGYWACRPDFADLPQVVERILDNREAALEAAWRFRDALIQGSAPEAQARHFVALFRQAAAPPAQEAAALALAS